MTDVIEFTDNITDKTFAVDPYAVEDFIRHNWDKARAEVTEEIDRIYQDAQLGQGGFSDLLRCDYAPGVYDGELPACGWVEED